MERIIGQVIYAGPTVGAELPYGKIYLNGVDDSIYNLIAACPPIGSLFVTPAEFPFVRRELNLDYTQSMRGSSGRYVQFYRAVQQWLATRARETKAPKPKGVKVKSHASTRIVPIKASN